jgi:BASS family bile acid:Na+ symporter
MITLPILGFLIATSWAAIAEVPSEFLVGLMILAACPGGITSNLLTHLAKGDTALSISLTAVLGMVSFLTVPFVVNFSLQHFHGAEEAVQLPVLKTSLSIFLMTTAPVIFGMLIKHYKSAFADQIEPKTRKFSVVAFVVIVIFAILKDWQLVVDHTATLGPATLALNLGTMVLATIVCRMLFLEKRQEIAITIECGLQNATFAIFIAMTLLGNQMMMLPGGLYSILMFVTAGGYLLLLRQTEKPRLESVTLPSPG